MKKILIYTLLNLAVVGITNAQDKTSTGSTTGTSTSQTDVKTKVEALYQEAYSKFKASNFDASLNLVSQAEALLKANSMTDVRFQKLRDEIAATQKAKATNSTSTGTGSSTGSTTTAANSVDTKYKLEAMYQEASSKLKASNPDAALQIIANAEAIMKNTGVTDSRFTQLKSDALAMQKSKSNGGSTTGGNTTGGTSTGGTNSSSGTTTVDSKTTLDNYYNDAYSLYKTGKYDDATAIIVKAEDFMKAKGLTDVRFGQLRDLIKAKK